MSLVLCILCPIILHYVFHIHDNVSSCHIDIQVTLFDFEILKTFWFLKNYIIYKKLHFSLVNF